MASVVGITDVEAATPGEDEAGIAGASAKDSMSLSHASAHLLGSNSSLNILIFPQLSQPAGMTIRSRSSALAGWVNLKIFLTGAGASVEPIDAWGGVGVKR